MVLATPSWALPYTVKVRAAHEGGQILARRAIDIDGHGAGDASPNIALTIDVFQNDVVMAIFYRLWIFSLKSR